METLGEISKQNPPSWVTCHRSSSQRSHMRCLIYWHELVNTKILILTFTVVMILHWQLHYQTWHGFHSLFTKLKYAVQPDRRDIWQLRLVLLNMNEKFYCHLSERDLYLPLISIFLPVGDMEDLSDIRFCVVFPGLAVSHTDSSSKRLQ